MKLAELCAFLDEFLNAAAFEDYEGAFNGLQLDRDDEGGEVRRVCVAVDACQATIAGAAQAGADLLLVHHGLLWGGLRPFVGPLYHRLKQAMHSNLAIYASHLPLDAHPEVGNAALLVRAMGLTPDSKSRFAEHKGQPIGYLVNCDLERFAWQALVAEAVRHPCRLIAAGPQRIQRFGVVTGGGASFLEEAARLGCDTLLTGEASHRHYFEAEEWGINLCLAGHYATEVFGVRALGALLAERFGMMWSFLDHDTGM